MRERLIELLKKADEYASGVCTDYDEAQEVCADYLLAEGVIVPPVKIGQKVYIIGWCNDIEEFVVRDVHLVTNGKGGCSYSYRAVIGSKSDIHFMDYYIGSTVFLTKEEAEKVLHKINHNSLCETETYKIKQ